MNKPETQPEPLPPAPGSACLTDRQIQVVKRLSEGATVKAIALDLGLSEKTVEFHSMQARLKMGNLSIAILTRFAIINGLSELNLPNDQEAEARRRTPLPPAPGSALMLCPFCGSPKVSVRFYNQPSVVCHKCLCMGPAASRLRKDNQAQCQQEASERWNQRPSSDDELYHKLVELIEWAETLLCNAQCPKHCKPDEWREILRRWRDEWHESHKSWKRTPSSDEDAARDEWMSELAETCHAELRPCPGCQQGGICDGPNAQAER